MTEREVHENSNGGRMLIKSAGIQIGTALLFATASITACAIGGPVASTEVAPPSKTQPATPSPTSSQATARPTSIPSGYAVSQAIALRNAGKLGSKPFTLVGYWSSRIIGHSCAAPPQPQTELELWCHSDEYGITERDEPFAEWIPPNRLIPADGPRLTPWMPDEIAKRLFGLPMLGKGDVFFPPVPIVLLGHFDDPRAADCHEQFREACHERLVIDEVVSFDPDSVPAPTPTPAPTPFPSPAPAALFGPEQCAGDVDYAFVGWATMDELKIYRSYEGHVFAMVTADVIRLSDWVEDPAGSGQRFRWWGQQVCFTEDYYIGQKYNVVPMGFDSVNATGFKEWEDGRREFTDSP